MTQHSHTSGTTHSSLIRFKWITQRLALGFLSLVALQNTQGVFAQEQTPTEQTTSEKPATRTPEQIAAAIDSYMTKQVEEEQFSGSVLVAQEGKPIISKGYGKASIELNVPNTPQTVFRIGSITKQFTAMAIMMLQERGKLKVSDSICKYLTNCPKAWKPITLENLLTHTSGIWNYTNTKDYAKVFLTPLERGQLVDVFRNKPLEFKPGERWNYSNSGYYLLGIVIERAARQSYESFLYENIFKPLSMKNTGFNVGYRTVDKLATGYSTLQSKQIIPNPLIDINDFSDGALYSNVEDLLVWDQALYTEKLVSKKSLDQMFTPFKLNSGNDYGYGYGWSIRGNSVSHGGRVAGFVTYISRFPQKGTTVIVLTNNLTLRDLKTSNYKQKRKTTNSRF
jgi:CubicO group peptidase (beta-lactamase class C family)